MDVLPCASVYSISRICFAAVTAVVVVLSKEYVQKPHPMEELQLLLDAMQRSEESTPATAKRGRLLPVWYMSESELLEAIQRFRAPDQDEQHKKWGAALHSIYGLTAVRRDQVRDLLFGRRGVQLGFTPTACRAQRYPSCKALFMSGLAHFNVLASMKPEPPVVALMLRSSTGDLCDRLPSCGESLLLAAIIAAGAAVSRRALQLPYPCHVLSAAVLQLTTSTAMYC
jgi:hypothetical protein